MNKENDIKVSVCIVTYNQEDLISQCLESVINQKTDFRYEIIVSDDASTDGTKSIIEDYANKYPELITPIYHAQNIGASNNVLFVYSKAKGEYIAHLDGDDYFLPNKLQIQANYLMDNPNCNIAFHKVDVIENGNIREQFIAEKTLNKKYYRKDIIEFGAIGCNSSKMFRRSCFIDPSLDFSALDYTLNVIYVGNGYAAFCSTEALAVYRKGIGVAGSNRTYIAAYKSLEFFLRKYPEYSTEINSASWAFFLPAIKNNKTDKWLFLKLIKQNFSIRGLINYSYSRPFRKNLSGLSKS